jgi:hypothetical protein
MTLDSTLLDDRPKAGGLKAAALGTWGVVFLVLLRRIDHDQTIAANGRLLPALHDRTRLNALPPGAEADGEGNVIVGPAVALRQDSIGRRATHLSDRPILWNRAHSKRSRLTEY